MIDHMGISVSDYPKSKTFYDAVFAALGGSLMKEIPLQFTGGKHVVGYGRSMPVFWLHEGAADNGRHYAFSAENRGSLRSGAHTGLTPNHVRYEDLSSAARSSHLNASSFSPSAAYTSAM